MCFFKNFSADKVGIYSIIMIFILFGTELFNKNPDLCMNRILSSFFGAFFIPLTLVYMIYIRDLNNGMEFVFFIFIVTWILDTAAYIFGKIFGKHKLAMSISPMKTIEGAIMGIIFAVLTSTICRNMFMSNILTLKNAVLLGIVISIVGQSSDLAESLIKRDVNVKDSGRIIPGHGGFFDRFDSYIFVAPIVYHILKFLK
jgi:phosphatidate cytidylyltransferase